MQFEADLSRKAAAADDVADLKSPSPEDPDDFYDAVSFRTLPDTMCPLLSLHLVIPGEQYKRGSLCTKLLPGGRWVLGIFEWKDHERPHLRIACWDLRRMQPPSPKIQEETTVPLLNVEPVAHMDSLERVASSSPGFDPTFMSRIEPQIDPTGDRVNCLMGYMRCR